MMAEPHTHAAGLRAQCALGALRKLGDYFFTGVRTFECARNSFSSALVYSRRKRFLTFLATTCS